MTINRVRQLSQNKLQALGISPTKALVIGIGTVVLAPTVASLLKPVAKATLKTGVVFYEKTKSTLAETGEVIGDIVAEAKSEIAEEQAKKLTLTVSTDQNTAQPSPEG